MFEPIDLSAYADPILGELVSGKPQIDGTLFLEILFLPWVLTFSSAVLPAYC